MRQGVKVQLNVKEYSANSLQSIFSKVEDTVGTDIEQVGNGGIGVLRSGVGGLVGLGRAAFNDHRHMVISPDDVWNAIERGLAIHITENAEELRSKFVNFSGKRTIDIRRDEFVRGKENRWEGCFDEFSEKIGDYIGKSKDLVLGKFSTTGVLERVSSEIILMDCMSKYFNYSCTTMCGIPVITLLGEVYDWEFIRYKAGLLREFGLGWWIDVLDPILEKLILAYRGEVDGEFWNSWYSEGGGSGGPYITGHVQKFYPYLGAKFRKNKFNFGECTLSDFPKGISCVPFVWDYFGTKLPMQFIGGIIGIGIGEGGRVSCKYCWGGYGTKWLSLGHFRWRS